MTSMIADTNVLIRVWARDDVAQADEAEQQFRNADRIYISNAALCEFVWVARQVYKQKRSAIAEAIGWLMSDPRVIADSLAVSAGLEFLGAGGDFANGIIEFEGRRLGGETFVTFDRQAAALITAKGRKSILLASHDT
jgi:predicted nucleic-acid-binding protein